MEGENKPSFVASCQTLNERSKKCKRDQLSYNLKTDKKQFVEMNKEKSMLLVKRLANVNYYILCVCV